MLCPKQPLRVDLAIRTAGSRPDFGGRVRFFLTSGMNTILVADACDAPKLARDGWVCDIEWFSA
jgi:hypothetical protein